jgi:hypothetical protein
MVLLWQQMPDIYGCISSCYTTTPRDDAAALLHHKLNMLMQLILAQES